MDLFSPAFWSRPLELGGVLFTPASLAAGLALLTLLLVAQWGLRRLLQRRIVSRFGFDEGVTRAIAATVGYTVLLVGILLILPIVSIQLRLSWLSWGFWFNPIPLGAVSFAPGTLLLGLVLLVVILLVHAWLKRLLVARVFPRLRLDSGLSHSLATLIGYLFIAVGILTILPVTFPGFSFTTLSVMLGAVSFGIGFGLRNIADNFVSGVIILFERPIKVGDRIALGELAGNVEAIRARSTTVRTNDNINIIVPNSQFIAEQVINWSHGDNTVRFRIPVGVHYNSDVRLVKQALEAAGTASPHVLADPGPTAKFMGFGDSALDFELWVWTDTMSARPSAFRSEINYLIWDSLKEHGIEIPYPQRDLYIKELPRPADAPRPGVDEPRQGSGL